MGKWDNLKVCNIKCSMKLEQVSINDFQKLRESDLSSSFGNYICFYLEKYFYTVFSPSPNGQSHLNVTGIQNREECETSLHLLFNLFAQNQIGNIKLQNHSHNCCINTIDNISVSSKLTPLLELESLKEMEFSLEEIALFFIQHTPLGKAVFYDSEMTNSCIIRPRLAETLFKCRKGIISLYPKLTLLFQGFSSMRDIRLAQLTLNYYFLKFVRTKIAFTATKKAT